jgi:hypothetical protein
VDILIFGPDDPLIEEGWVRPHFSDEGKVFRLADSLGDDDSPPPDPYSGWRRAILITDIHDDGRDERE